MTELDILKRSEYIHVTLNYLPDLRYDIGSLGPGNLVSAPEPRCTNHGAYPYAFRRDFCLPVLVSGQRAYKTTRGMSDDAGAEALDEHMGRAEKAIVAFYLMAVLALAGLLVPIKWPKAGLPLSAVTLAVTVICACIAIYIAQPGYRIRHPEFRPSETLTPYSETHHQDE